MARKPKTQRVPRTRAGGEWSEASYWNFIRSGLRNLSRRWPPLVRLAMEHVRRPNQSANKRLTWEYQCQQCGGWFTAKEVQVDHRDPAGQLRSYDDLPGFVERLLCEADGLQVLCVTCHREKTNATSGR